MISMHDVVDPGNCVRAYASYDVQNGEHWKCADAMKEVGERKLGHRTDEDVDASLVSCMRLEVLLTPALRNSSWRKKSQLDTTTQRTNFFMFSTVTLTLPVQQTMTPTRLVHKIRSCRAAADDANMFFAPTKIEKQDVEEAVQSCLRAKLNK